MNRLKSFFISASITTWAVFTYLFVLELINQGLNPWVLSILLISVLPFGFFMVLMSLRPVARTSKSLKWVTILVTIGASFTIIGVYKETISIEFSSFAGISLFLWILYVYWYSKLPGRKANLKVGDVIPALTFQNDDHIEISTSQFKGRKVLYMFYRGNWCPLCMAQIKEIAGQYKELERRGIEVLLISPQPAGYTRALAKKMAVNFKFLTDKGNKMARKLKIDHAHGTPFGMEMFGYTSETVLPTVIITDEEGKVLFLDQTDNYRIRPEPETFLKAIGV